MAGHYFYDPRPFYGQDNPNLMPLDELFYGRNDLIPYWMDQRMLPMDYEDLYPSYRRMGNRVAETQQYVQRGDRFAEYRRPAEVQDDLYANFYERHHEFNGRTAIPSGFRPRPDVQRGQTRDDMWVPTMPNAKHQNQYSSRGQEQRRKNSGRDGDAVYCHTDVPMNYLANRTNNNVHDSQKHSNSIMNQPNYGRNTRNGCEQFNSQAQGYNSMQRNRSDSNQTRTQQRYVKDESSDEEDFYGNENNENGNFNYIQNPQTQSYNKGFQNQKFDNSQKLSINRYDGQREVIRSQEKSNLHSHGANIASVDSDQLVGKKQASQLYGFKSKNTKFQDDEYSSGEDQEYYKTSQGHQKQGFTGGSQQRYGSELSKGVNQLKVYSQQFKQPQYGHSQVLELKVPLCCDNCERKVRACLAYVSGVEHVFCDQWQKKVTVVGNVKPDSVLRRVRRVKKASELWQQPKRF